MSEQMLLTYEELAERLGVSPEAARQRARRRDWKVVRGNAGKARVRVSEADLAIQPEPRRPAERTDVRANEQADEIRRLRDEVLGLHVALARAEERLAARDQALDEVRSELRRERARVDRLETRLLPPWWLRIWGF